MKSDWPVVSLEKVTSILGDGLHGTPKYDENGEYYFINGNNLKDGKIVITEKTKRSDSEQYEKHKKDLNERTILVSINGTIGNVAEYNGEPVFLGKSACYFNVKEDVDKKYVKYVVSSPIFKSYLNRLASGSTIKNVSLKLMREFSFKLPPLEIQRGISNVLSALDEKIEINSSMNQTLEKIAQRIFKSWFIDFDPVKANAEGVTFADLSPDIQSLFPSEFVESEMGLIPKGWDVQQIGDEVTCVGGATPSTSNPDFWEGGELLWTTPKDLSGEESKILFDTARKITHSGLKKISSGLLPVNTVLMSSRAPVGYLALAKEQVAINQGYIAMKCENTIGPLYLLNWLERNMDTIKQSAGGTTFSEISKKSFRPISMLVSDRAVANAFEDIVTSLYEKIEANVRQNASLRLIRDKLLPKLLSGSIEIKQELDEAS